MADGAMVLFEPFRELLRGGEHERLIGHGAGVPSGKSERSRIPPILPDGDDIPAVPTSGVPGGRGGERLRIPVRRAAVPQPP
ncbi:hypothetical protein GCM10009834_29220 [Streptomonospora arabica]